MSAALTPTVSGTIPPRGEIAGASASGSASGSVAGSVSGSLSVSVRPLLTRFAVALNRRRAYAATHPMVLQAEAELLAALTDMLAAHGQLSLGVAHRELLCNGAPVDGGGSVARELAERLHRRGVGALTFQPGVAIDALRLALSWLARELPPGAKDPSPEAAPSVPGITIGRLAYDRLVLGDPAANARQEASAIWRALASAAFELEELEESADSVAAPSGATPGGVTRGGHAPEASLTGIGESPAGRALSLSDSTPDIAADNESDTDDPLASASAEDIAAAIEQRAQQEPYARRVAQVLLSLATQVSNAPPAVREELGQRLRSVLHRLGDSSLATVLRAAGTGREQRQLLSEVVSALPAQAVVEWLEVAARATDQEMSHQLLRILGKLSRHATDRRGRGTEQLALRSAARDLVAGWRLSDPNPVAHRSLLDHIALFDSTTLPGFATRIAPEITTDALSPGSRAKAPGDGGSATADLVALGADGSDGEPDAFADVEITAEHAIAALAPKSTLPGLQVDEPSIPGESGRLIKLACEIGLVGEDAISAAQQLVADGHTVRLFEWLDASPNVQTARALRDGAVAPTAVSAALSHEPFDAAAVRVLIAALPVEAAPMLLDALESLSSRSARRLLYDRLREYGPALVPELLRRLQGSPPWYFARNLLALLRDASTAGDSTSRAADLRQFLHHPAEQVRIEAVRILLEDGSTRELAMRQALDDDCERIVRAGIDGALALSDVQPAGGRSAITSVIASRLMHLVDEGEYDPELLARAVRALAGSPGPTVRDWLLAQVTRRTLVLRRTSLADASPVVLAALGVLAALHGRDPRVAPILEQARAQHDARRTAVVGAKLSGASR